MLVAGVRPLPQVFTLERSSLGASCLLLFFAFFAFFAFSLNVLFLNLPSSWSRCYISHINTHLFMYIFQRIILLPHVFTVYALISIISTDTYIVNLEKNKWYNDNTLSFNETCGWWILKNNYHSDIKTLGSNSVADGKRLCYLWHITLLRQCIIHMVWWLRPILLSGTYIIHQQVKERTGPWNWFWIIYIS